MTKTIKITIIAAAACWLAACAAPANNAPAVNTAAVNAAKPASAAPTKDALLALDKQANDAYIRGDAKFFDDFLSDKFVMYEGGQRMDKAATVKMIGTAKCAIKEGWTLDDPQMSMIDADTYVISYKTNFDGTCNGPDGKPMKALPTRSASVFVRNGDKWQGAFHGENTIIDPKNPPPAEPKKPEPKKAGDKKDEAKTDDKSAANNSNASAKPAAQGFTDALVKIHTEGWEAWKAKDAKRLEAMTSSNLAEVDPAGTWFGTKADVIKQWTEGMKCEGVTNVKLSDGFASTLSPNVGVLTVKGNADGTCDGHKNGDLYQTAFYVKEGDAWKLAFMFESAAM